MSQIPEAKLREVKPALFTLPEPEKKGVMCTVCKRVHWGLTDAGQLNRGTKCGNLELIMFINVTSADFNKYSARYMRGLT